MLISKIRSHYEDPKPSSGNPTGSRFGACTAQLQQLLYPQLTKPEPIPPRARMVMEEGRRVEAWLKQEARKLIPAEWALEEFPFYLSVPLTRALTDQAATRINARYKTDGRLWGTILPGFLPSKFAQTSPGKFTFRGIPEQAIQTMRDGTKLFPPVLDPDAQIFYAPMTVDAIGLHPRAGLSIIDIKSMSNFGFRRAANGNMGYGYRAQLAGAAEATGFNVVFICYRKETSHLLEFTVERGYAGKTRLEIELLNGTREVMYVARPALDEEGTPELETEKGESAQFPGDAEWDLVDVQSPFEASLVEEIREHIRRVIGTQPGKWHRQYGVDFLCRTCGGAGQQTLAKTGKREPLKAGPKLCPDCNGMGWLTEALLKYPCTYCPVVTNCYPMSELRIEGGKPYYTIKKADWERAGLSFTRPKSF